MSLLFLIIKQYNLKYIIIWGSAALLFTFFYLNSVTTPNNQPYHELLTKYPHVILINFLYFLGSGFQISKYMLLISIFVGLFSISWWGYLIYKKYYFTNTVIFILQTWIMLAAAMATLNRSGTEIDVINFTTSRYKVYSLLNINTSVNFESSA